MCTSTNIYIYIYTHTHLATSYEGEKKHDGRNLRQLKIKLKKYIGAGKIEKGIKKHDKEW